MTQTTTMTIGQQPAAKPKNAFQRMLRDPQTVIGFVLILFTLLVVFIGPLVTPHAPDAYIASPFAPPSEDMLFGADARGRDILSRALVGGATVVWMSVSAAAMGVTLGTILGTVAGYTRGWLDEVIMRLADVAMAVPTIVFVLLFVSVLGPEPWLLVVLIGTSHAPQVARVIRGTTLEIREREFVEASRALGAPAVTTITRQIIPNVMVPVMVEFGIRVVWSVAMIASLSVIGQGLRAPIVDWGVMINENRAALTYQPWGVLVPLFLIAIFALGANIVAEGVSRTYRMSGGQS